jgi:signal transduction histidine kinase
MARELGFYSTIAVAGWLVLGPLLGRSAGRGELALSALGLTGGLWATGELLFLSAESHADFVLAGRVFLLGTAGLAPVWLWLSVKTFRPDWFVAHPGRIIFAFALPLALYSALFWDESGLFLEWRTPTRLPHRGPWFQPFLMHQLVVILLGTVYFVRTAMRLRRTSPVLMSGLLCAVFLPLSVTVAFQTGMVSTDWTGIVLGPAAILFWLAIVETGLIANLPIDRHRLIEQLDVGVVVADPASRVLSANPAARRLAPLDGGLRGRALSDVLASAEQRPDRSVESRALTLQGPMGVAGHALILTDRTEAEVSRRRLELAGRLEALGSLTAGIAHEVNNPLAYVQSNLCCLGTTVEQLADPVVRERLPEPLQAAVSEMGALVEETQEGLERIRLLVQRLKTFTRAPDLSARTPDLDLCETVRQAAAVAMVGREHDSIQIDAESDLRVDTLESAVFQILVNLLLNAIQAAPEAPAIRVCLRSQGEGVAIEVIDRGPGIPASVLPRIFDPFFTTRSTGTGLGLSLSYDLARQLGGRLQAANHEEGGAIFTFWIPRSGAGSSSGQAGSAGSGDSAVPVPTRATGPEELPAVA